MSKHTTQPLKSALKKHYADQSLSSRQLDRLQQTQQSAKHFAMINRFKWPVSMVASFLLLVTILSYFQTPALITSAYADIYKDENINNGLQPTMQQWLTVNHIASVPPQYPVKMSKFCRLGSLLTTHLRIAGKQQGEMHVFIHQGERKWSTRWVAGTGTVDDINWKLLQVRDDLTVIVLYTRDMREKSVRHILNEMLPQLEV